jgi:hypothetical protein
MSQEQERREYVASMYDGPRWKARVASMSNNQITAIYLRFIKDGQKPSDTPLDISKDVQIRLF